MTRKTLALVPPALLLVVAPMAGTTMAMQVTKIKPDTPGVTIIKEVTTPNTGVLLGPVTLSSGQELRVCVQWAPSYATLLISVVNANTGLAMVPQ